MSPAEALEIVVARTLHTRYRELCDPDHPDYSPGCPDLMLRLARGLPDSAPSRAPLAETLRLLALMRACPDRIEETDCGCGGLATCARGRGRGGLVNHQDCTACLKGP